MKTFTASLLTVAVLSAVVTAQAGSPLRASLFQKRLAAKKHAPPVEVEARPGDILKQPIQEDRSVPNFSRAVGITITFLDVHRGQGANSPEQVALVAIIRNNTSKPMNNVRYVLKNYGGSSADGVDGAVNIKANDTCAATKVFHYGLLPWQTKWTFEVQAPGYPRISRDFQMKD